MTSISIARLKWVLDFQEKLSVDKEVKLPVDQISFRNANFEGANLQIFDVSHLQGPEYANLRGAKYNSKTFPEGFNKEGK